MKRSVYIGVAVLTAAVCNAQVNAATASENNNKSPGQTQSATEQDSTGQKIAFNQFPAAVQKTIRGEAGTLNIENTRKFTHNGQTCYEASFDKAGMKGKLTVGADGSLLRYTETENFALVSAVPKVNTGSGMSLNDLPDAVKKIIQNRANTNQVGDISKSTESGKTQYHVAFNEGGVHTDLWLDADGKVIGRADETALFATPLQSSQNSSFAMAPKAVQQTLREHAGSPENITDLDKGTWNGQTAYRALVSKNGSVRPLLISEDGKVLQSQHGATGAPAGSQTSNGSQTSQGSQKGAANQRK